MLERYQPKIKTIEELVETIGFERECLERDRKTLNVVMCHGVFDIVHPGHLRHLLFAKQQGDVLVVSLTADRFVSKGVLRPHVPEEMRALNLACLEFVDYVIIDQNPRPEENIQRLKPDVYAKGFEYSGAARGRGVGEAEIVEAYGGRVIYTPGDFVLSSTALLKEHLPDLRREKLELTLNRAGLTVAHLRETLERIAERQPTVHVVGDTIVDSYTHCSMIGGQTKTPTISARFDKRLDFVGGAAVVAKHLKAAGARVVFSTVLGDDRDAAFVLADLDRAGVAVDAISEPGRPTVNKNAIVVEGYRMLKVDTLNNQPIDGKTLDHLCESIRDNASAATVFADFRHGIFNRRTIDRLAAAIPRSSYSVADSQVASRWGNILDFKSFNLITPNEREARFALGDQDTGVRPLASQLYATALCDMLLLKLGERGVYSCWGENFEAPEQYAVLDSFVDRVVDAVGAGDALLAYTTLGMITAHNPVIATVLGSMAAAVECEVDGNEPVTPEQVLTKLEQFSDG